MFDDRDPIFKCPSKKPGTAALIDAPAAIIRKDAGSDQRLAMDYISAESSGYFSTDPPDFQTNLT